MGIVGAARPRLPRVVSASLAFILITIGPAACSDDDPTKLVASRTTTTSRIPRVLPGAAPEYLNHPQDWVLPGRDYDNSRATFESQINAGNIGELQVRWEAPVSGALLTVPIIVGDTVYVQDGSGVISAFDRQQGKLRWKTQPYGSNIGPFGVVVAENRVFGLLGSRGVVAVAANTGTELWRKEISATKTTGIDIQPTYFDNKIFVSTVPVSLDGIYTGGDRGILHALDANTGGIVWTFDTVKGDLWGHPEINSGGGAWYPPAIDPQRKLMYWGTANPAPFPGTTEFPNGSSRPGDNLYTDSAIALDIDTGKLRWYHQVHAHDLFDRDLVHTMIAQSGKHQVVVATGKGGVVVGLDPNDGTRLWSTTVGMHRNDELQLLNGPNEIAPETFGGVLTSPATADGIAYVAVINAPTTLNGNVPTYIGGDLAQHNGEVVAIDTATGAVQWTTKLFGDPLGGVTIVNDLVLTTLVDGTLVAIDRARGTQVLQLKLIGGTNGSMSVSDDLIIVPVGNTKSPRLIAFGL